MLSYQNLVGIHVAEWVFILRDQFNPLQDNQHHTV